MEIENLDTGVRETIECDTVVLTGDWIPDHELARSAGLDIDPGTRGPLVDTALRTSRAGVFAAGNLVHPVDTADVAAIDGRHVAGQVAAYLGGKQPGGPGVRIEVESPLRWVAPGIIRPNDPQPARNRLLLWTDERVRRPEVTARQGGRIIGHTSLRWPASPGRIFRVPSPILAGADLGGGPVMLSVRGS